MTEAEIVEWADGNKFLLYKVLPGDQVAAVVPMLFQKYRLVIGPALKPYHDHAY